MNSFICWIGGKKAVKERNCKRFPESFNRYIEVFGGAAWVLFSKDKLANMEVYNDINGDLQRELSFTLNSRELFYDFANQYGTRGMTDIQRAARFFMLIKTSYGSDCRSYGCVKKDVNVMIQYLTDIQERLSGVVIENKGFQDLLKVYDKDGSLIYLDPPYYGTEGYYQTQFSEKDHIRLSDCLKGVKGKFILSYNDCEFIRKLYKDFNIDEVDRNHNLVGKYKGKNTGMVS